MKTWPIHTRVGKYGWHIDGDTFDREEKINESLKLGGKDLGKDWPNSKC